MKGKNIRSGLQIISLHRLLQRFSRQQKGIITILLIPTYNDNQFSAVEMRRG